MIYKTQWTLQRNRQHWVQDTERQQTKQKHNAEKKEQHGPHHKTGMNLGARELFL